MKSTWHTSPNRQAYVRVDLTVLREMLRLPSDVTISCVRAGDDAQHCIVELSGPALPADGELLADYNFQHLTHVTFTGFKKS